MAITLYGTSQSRALRSVWAMEEAKEEAGVDYEHIPTHFAADTKTDDYADINPNRRIPALIDGDTKLFESMAINLYLAKNYAPGLYPSDAGAEGQVLQWSVWGIAEIEPFQMQIVVQKLFLPEDKRDPAVVARAEKGLARPLDVLEHALAERQWLVGDRFSIADLNVAAVMLLLEMIAFDLSAWPNIQRWLAVCYARPALAKARARA